MCYKYFICDPANVNFDANNVDNIKRGEEMENEGGEGKEGKPFGRRFVRLFVVGIWKAPLMADTLLW